MSVTTIVWRGKNEEQKGQPKKQGMREINPPIILHALAGKLTGIYVTRVYTCVLVCTVKSIT